MIYLALTTLPGGKPANILSSDASSSDVVCSGFAGNNYALARLMYYKRIFNLPSPLGNGVYLGGSLEAGRVASILDKRDGQGTLRSASTFFAADTFLGFAGGGGENSFYLMFGVPY